MSDAQPLPKYIQISERLIREIAAGHIADGARLAPERDMAADLGIAVGTLRKALGDLEEKGLLERIQGSGNYVRHKPGVESVYAFFRLERVTGGGLPTAEVLSVDRLPKPEGPRFGPSSEGHRIRRLRRLDRDVIALEEIWLDAGLIAKINRPDLSESLYLYYRERLGLVIARVEDRIGAEPVPDWTDARFDPVQGTPVGYIERIGWTSAAEPVEFSRTWFDMSKARYVSRMGKG